MVRCPNCGQETKGDFCQWCGYPVMRGRLVRGQRAERAAKEKAKREAELAAKERVKMEAKETREKAKREAEEAKEAKRAEEKAKKEAELEAKERANREAEEAKEAKRAEEKTKEAVELEVDAGLYEGVMELTIVPPIDLGQMENLEKDLRQVENLRLVLVGGSVDEGNKIVVSAEKPIPLLRILGEMPAVEQVVRKGDKIQVTLKAE